MIIFLLILTIGLIISCFVGEDKGSDSLEWLCGIGAFVFGVLTFIVICWGMILSYDCYGISDKIEMYQEENEIIEQQMDTLVKQYMDYESDTLKEFASESSITLITMYPDLKSDTMVQNQINTYIANNNKIKELKELKIQKGFSKWLWYFGK